MSQRMPRAKAVVLLSAVLAMAILGVMGVRATTARRVSHPRGAAAVKTPELRAIPGMSVNGQDFTVAADDLHSFTVCDIERDGNPVRGVAETESGGKRSTIRVDDLDGAGGDCTKLAVRGTIMSIQTCERNHIAWVCGNKQAPPPA